MINATLTPQSAELLLLKRQRLAALEQKVQSIRAFGLAHYRPHPKQDAFHRAGGRFKRRMVRAGNRFGKSQMGCAEDCAWAIGERVWYPKDDPARTAGIPAHPIKGLIITTDWDKVDEIWTSERGDNPGKVWKFLPKDSIVSKKRNHSGAIETIEIKSSLYSGNSLLRFDTVKSFLSNPQGSESSDWDFVHVDEPCPEKMFKANARGLMDRNGASWFTLTPLAEFWINDFFFPQDTGGQARDGVWSTDGSTYDNPYLSREAIKEYEDTLTDEEKQCRIHGIPLHLSGLVYKGFSWDKHVLKDIPLGWADWITPPKHYPIYVHIDPHPQTPHAVLFCTVLPTGERVYFHDIFYHTSIDELSIMIKDVVQHRGYNLAAIYADPLAFIEHPITETSMATEFQRNGLPVMKATKALAQGILRVNGELGDYKKTPPRATRVHFTPMCRRSLWEIQRYCWDEKNDRPIDAEDHMMENLYRQELSSPRWIDYSDEKSNGPIGDMAIESARFDLGLEPFSTAM